MGFVYLTMRVSTPGSLSGTHDPIEMSASRHLRADRCEWGPDVQTHGGKCVLQTCCGTVEVVLGHASLDVTAVRIIKDTPTAGKASRDRQRRNAVYILGLA
jgi:hypothetical protein